MSEDQELAKDLGPLAALTIGVGTMIGAGIFVLPGPAVARAGPLVALSFVAGGVIALLTALSASELGTAMPKAGGAYYYVNHALGPLFGSIAGWANWMGLAFASAFYMFGFGQYVGEFLSVPGIALGPIALSPAKVIALVGAGLFIGVNYVGAKETGRLQNGIVITLVVILAGFTVLGAMQADLSTLRPIAPFGYGPLLPTTGLIFVSYLGFVQITSVGEEIKDPGRNLPRAVIGSVLIVTVVYALVLLVLLAVVETPFVANNETAVVDVARRLAGPVGAGALLFGGLLATASSANASILASSRINFAMGRDGIVTPWLNEIHERFATPYRSIGLTGLLILVFIVFGDIERLATAGSVLHLLIYGLLNVSLIVMREVAPPDYDPDYEVPLYPVTPIVGAIISFALIAFIEPLVILLSVAFVVFAVLWYAFYARTRSRTTGVATTALRRRQAGPQTTQTGAAVTGDGGTYRVLVPLSHPGHVDTLLTLGGAIARANDGRVVAVHIVEVPDQTSLSYAADHPDKFDLATGDTLDRAVERADELGVNVETHTIFSHRTFEEIFDAAATHDADTVVMGWTEGNRGSPGRAESAIDELAHDLPADFLVLKDRGFDPARVLVPTAGGPDSDLSAVVARVLSEEYDAEVSLLHVADDQPTGEAFLANWADAHDLEDATQIVASDDVESAIERAATDATLLILGASEEGLLSRVWRGSLVLDVVDEVECSVVLAETKRNRSLWQRLLG